MRKPFITVFVFSALAAVSSAFCVKDRDDCPSGTHGVEDPVYCVESGYSYDHQFFCARDSVKTVGIRGRVPPPNLRGACVRECDECPSGTHCENEPEICRDLGFPPHYHLLCVGGFASNPIPKPAPVAKTMPCVRKCDECPSGTHCENEPEICRDMGFPPHYHLLCVGGDPNSSEKSSCH
ncbi:hypothetical protein BCR41DRAFT_347803 [Lobosporangium transversale]|uniref:Uncharacterized protein n=1 Tax=Lobosporangium transversale TaxID=64571 RepID=A0A1Y2GZ10_9FUNG|nr:hypothetical protein BCR41DRAFT_347801 [Lobosporangium transversale]XP_021884476.1 hypothetical protein BCR41DRAFT_347803 [Lobosporangium transversale]ORZ26712.1 hypothetical protein BCR41DRAFT_347801 [Lobosporangium transversale]ORZ26713.1 hypothetical protein BCR41DRAFT_347803 [Lobosporangium transversale]|eukprot:XP_021884475.1 hypothetical protein BCR41DRAFT_347801 [Lobosporangium transversale]